MPKVELEIGTPALRELTNVVKSLSSEVMIKLTASGLEIKTMDASHVAMLLVRMDKGAFQTYSVEPVSIGLDFEKLSSVLRLAAPDSKVRLSLEKERLVVKVGNLTRQMAIIDPTGIADPKVPAVTTKTVVGVKVADLLQAVRGSESISDHVTLLVSEDGFTVHAEGEQDKLDTHLPKGELSKFQVEATGT